MTRGANYKYGGALLSLPPIGPPSGPLLSAPGLPSGPHSCLPPSPIWPPLIWPPQPPPPTSGPYSSLACPTSGPAPISPYPPPLGPAPIWSVHHICHLLPRENNSLEKFMKQPRFHQLDSTSHPIFDSLPFDIVL